MSIIGRLNKPNFKPTKSDKILLEYIKDNLNEIPYMQISNMAKQVGIGEATITRCVKKLGCSGFQDFKLGLTKEISIREENRILNVDIGKNEVAIETATKIANSGQRAIEETLTLIDNKEILRLRDEISSKNRVFFVGIGFSGISARQAHYKFVRIGINSYYYDNSYEIMMMASLASEGDLIFVFSNSGETTELLKAVEIAKENGARIVCISGNDDSSISRISDKLVLYYTEETLLETGSMSTSIAQSFIIEILYTEVVKNNLVETTSTKIKTAVVVKGSEK